MRKRLLLAAVIPALLGTPIATSHAQDMAAERARIANQRIEAEAARIAEEEKRRAEAAAAEAVAAKPHADSPQPTRSEQQPAVTSAPPPAVVTATPMPAATPPAPAPAARTDRIGMTRMLEHIRVLGQLRDSGYVTEAEFERIKTRIIDGEL